MTDKIIENYFDNYKSKYSEGLTRNEIIEIANHFKIDIDKIFNELRGQTGIIINDELLNYKYDIENIIRKILLNINYEWD